MPSKSLEEYVFGHAVILSTSLLQSCLADASGCKNAARHSL